MCASAFFAIVVQEIKSETNEIGHLLVVSNDRVEENEASLNMCLHMVLNGRPYLHLHIQK